MRHFLSIAALDSDTLRLLLDNADHFKDDRGAPSHRKLLDGRSIVLLFEKASTRTRISLEIAVAELGGTPLVIGSSSSQLGRGEPLEDTARVLSRMAHAITYRTYSQAGLELLAANSTIPVLNALTDQGHPMQLLADLMTVRREFGSLEGLRYAWVGDGNNMAHSWIEAAGVLGLELALACPTGFDPDAKIVEAAAARGAKLRIERDPLVACDGAHVISTDVFASMGQEAEARARLEAFEGFCVDERVMEVAAPNAIALHCLPAHRGEEIAAEVIDGPQSRVWDQAEARLHTSKAALCWAFDVRVR
jgi:ornithine carbamoyltransferase